MSSTRKVWYRFQWDVESDSVAIPTDLKKLTVAIFKRYVTVKEASKGNTFNGMQDVFVYQKKPRKKFLKDHCNIDMEHTVFIEFNNSPVFNNFHDKTKPPSPPTSVDLMQVE